MRIVFFGSTELGFSCCKKLVEENHNVVGIFTIPKIFNISYSPGEPINNYMFRDFADIGKIKEIPIIQVEKKLSLYKEDLLMMRPDILIVAGWYYKIPGSFRKMCKNGCVALHASLLPKYRGNAPLVWAMINGEKETGVSLFYLEEEIDSGEIIAQTKFGIESEDTIRELISKSTDACLRLLHEYVPLLEKGVAPRIAQDHSKATTFPPRSPKDGLIDWTWEAHRIKNFIRAQTKPYPGAYFESNGKKITIWDADISES